MNPEQTQVLVHRVKQLMARHHLSQAELASKAGVSAAAVSRLLSGDTKTTSLETAEKLAGAFEKSVVELTERAFPIRRKTAMNTLLNTSCLEILKRVGLTGIDLLTGGISGLCTNGEAIVKELARAEPPEMAWTLLHLSMCTALKRVFAKAPSDIHQLVIESAQNWHQIIDQQLEHSHIIADRTILTEPAPTYVTKIMNCVAEELLPRLVGLGEPEAVAKLRVQKILALLRSSFLELVLLESCREEYSRLLAAIQDSPFDPANRRERGWTTYCARFRNQVEQPLFEEAFSIRDVHVPLRAWSYYELETSVNRADCGTGLADDESDTGRLMGSEKRWGKQIEDLSKALDDWLKTVWDVEGNYHFGEAFRFLTGDPGSGKSTESRLFALRHMEGFNVPGTGRTLRVLFVPLQAPFNYNDSLVRGVGHYCRQVGLTENPLEAHGETAPLLLIFDGLDELYRSGDLGVETAREFVREVREEVQSLKDVRQISVLFCGRPISIDKATKEKSQVWHLLPYLASKEDCKEFSKGQQLVWADDKPVDQRIDWWNKYQCALGQIGEGIPSDLPHDHRELNELTKVPMLNYLVALSRKNGFPFTSEFNVCSLYEHMLCKVWERGYGYEGHRHHRSVQGLQQTDFEVLLEQIALAACHTAGRTVTVDHVLQYLDEHQLGCLNQLNEDMQGRGELGAGGLLVRLFLAFYIQIEQQDPTQRTYEFTHKSFGEFLAARGMIRRVLFIFDEWNRKQQNPRGGGFSDEHALVEWLKLFGPTRLTHELFRFICAEFEHGCQRSKDERTIVYHGVASNPTALSHIELDNSGTPKQHAPLGLREFINSLINHVLRHSMPAHKLEGGRTFHDMNQQSINAEEALLAMHFAVNAAAHNAGLREVLGTRCNTQYTRLPKDVDWPDRTSLGAWLMRLTGMRRKNDRPILARTLRFLPMQSNLLLHGVDLTGADFREVNLNGVDLSRAGLQRADLSSAMLHRASLCGANLSEADLENVGLRLAQVVRADLRRTNLQGAGLYGVELGGADLGCAQLGKADLVSAYMRRSNVGGADVADAILRGATFDSDQLSVTTGRPACLPDGTQPTDDNWRGPLPHDE